MSDVIEHQTSTTYLFNEDGEALILKGFRELDILGSLVVYSQRGDNHVGQAPQELSHHAVPLFLVTVVHLVSRKGRCKNENEQINLLSARLAACFSTLQEIWVKPNGARCAPHLWKRLLSYIRERFSCFP